MPSRPPSHRPHPAAPRPPDPRPSASRRGYGTAWQKARAAFLREHPLCAECQKAGRLTPATVVDHVVAHRGDEVAFWQGEWQALCARCHNAKTARGE